MNPEEKFIACVATLFIKRLRPTLDIEKSKDFEYIKNSGKSFIGWNPTASEARGKSIWEYYKANNLPAYFVERGALPDTVVIDPNGFLCDSSSYDEENWNFPLLNGQEQDINQYIADLTSDESSLEHQKSSRLNKDQFHSAVGSVNKELIFVPMQLETDTVIERWSDWVKGVKQFFKIVEQLADAFPDKVFMVKPHPLTHLKFDTQNNVINVDSLHYKDCLAYCDKVLLINSGLGLQALAWGKPVIIVGKAWYNFEGMNYKATDFNNTIDLLYADLPVDMEKAKRFLYFLKFVLYSDCIQTKHINSSHINRTDDAEYTNIRIFKGRE